MKFSLSHEWVTMDGGVATVGITHHAKNELGEIVYIELPSVGKRVKKGEEVAVLESTKAAADIYSPISGEIVEINQELHHLPGVLNRFPEAGGWLFKVRIQDQGELSSLMEKEEYQKLIEK